MLSILVQVLVTEQNREPRENRGRARRCDRGRRPHDATGLLGWEGAADRMIRESEDLPEQT